MLSSVVYKDLRQTGCAFPDPDNWVWAAGSVPQLHAFTECLSNRHPFQSRHRQVNQMDTG